MRRIDNLLSQVTVASNPHRDPKDAKKFVDDLLEEQRFMRGEDNTTELDRAAVEELRSFMSNKSRNIGVGQV